jgi:hypothetical protein
MIDIRELQIGNFVNNKLDNEPEIWTLNHFRKIHDYSMELSDYEFIEITEDWLLRMGFVYSKDSSSMLEFIDIESGLKLFYRIVGSTVYVYSILGHIVLASNFVHQLQNLFYALSGGVELTIAGKKE